MSRYIDADELNIYDVSPADGFVVMGVTEEDIALAPSIDICFCRECKWFDSGKNDSEIWSMCTRHFGKYIDVNADDFCSYGSRSEKPNNSKERSSE